MGKQVFLSEWTYCLWVVGKVYFLKGWFLRDKSYNERVKFTRKELHRLSIRWSSTPRVFVYILQLITTYTAKLCKIQLIRFDVFAKAETLFPTRFVHLEDARIISSSTQIKRPISIKVACAKHGKIGAWTMFHSLRCILHPRILVDLLWNWEVQPSSEAASFNNIKAIELGFTATLSSVSGPESWLVQ